MVGTPEYMAPEIVALRDKDGGYSKAVDIWAMGVVLYILCALVCVFGAALTCPGSPASTRSRWRTRSRCSITSRPGAGSGSATTGAYSVRSNRADGAGAR